MLRSLPYYLAAVLTWSLIRFASAQSNPPTDSPYQVARAAARRGDSLTALRELKQAVAQGYYSEEMLRAEPDFATLTTQPGWARVLRQAWQKQQRHEASFNPAMLSLIQKMRYLDQHNRLLAEEADQKYGINSPQAAAVMRQQDQLDARLILQADSLVAIYGYPGKSLVGEYYKSVVFLIIQHNPDEKYLPMVTAAADKGELNWSSVALLIDRVKIGKGEQQIYGSQPHIWPDGRKQLYPIEDEPNVNVRRAKVGLGPLEAYLKNFGIPYQVPTATHNSNPPELYFTRRSEQEEKSAVELIGGYEALCAQLRYPAAARAAHITGRVTLQMLIDLQGIPQEVVVIKGLSHGCDEEALRVIRAAHFSNSSGQDHEIRMSLPFPYEKSAAGSGK
jgi:TonB family protein